MELGPLVALADKITSFALALVILAAGSKGIWVWGSTLKERDERIKRMEAKIETQERLIDRLSGVADRSTQMATTEVVRHARSHLRERQEG